MFAIDGRVDPNGQTMGKTVATVASVAVPLPLANAERLEAAADLAKTVSRKGGELVGKVEQFGQEAAQGMRTFGQSSELVTANGATVGRTSSRAEGWVGQTADDLNSKIVAVTVNGNPSGIRFRDDYEAHIKTRDFSKASQKEGVSGCHNINELQQYDVAVNPTITKDSIKILSKTPHPMVKGIYNVEYQMPKLNSQLNPIGWRYQTKTTPFVKTVYDPAIISDAQMARWGREAFADAMQKNPAISGATNIKWRGTASNGLGFTGYADTKGSDAVRTFFPIF